MLGVDRSRTCIDESGLCASADQEMLRDACPEGVSRALWEAISAHRWPASTSQINPVFETPHGHVGGMLLRLYRLSVKRSRYVDGLVRQLGGAGRPTAGPSGPILQADAF